MQLSRASRPRRLALAYDNFYSHGSDERRQQFDAFRRQRGPRLAAFAAFELLRRRFRQPWWEWPDEWRKPDRARTQPVCEPSTPTSLPLSNTCNGSPISSSPPAATRARDAGPADRALSRSCGRRPARRFRRLVRSGFLSAERSRSARRRTRSIRKASAGAWRASIRSSWSRADCEPFRQVLRASMQYAGAIRLDHVLGLKRLYLVPSGVPADQGAYVQFPFEALLAAAADESVREPMHRHRRRPRHGAAGFSGNARRMGPLVVPCDAVRARGRRRLHRAGPLSRERAGDVRNP